jgi:hypothetical protein
MYNTFRKKFGMEKPGRKINKFVWDGNKIEKKSNVGVMNG